MINKLLFHLKVQSCTLNLSRSEQKLSIYCNSAPLIIVHRKRQNAALCFRNMAWDIVNRILSQATSRQAHGQGCDELRQNGDAQAAASSSFSFLASP